jgi:predicted type IV restriction endonuclease
VQRLWDQQHTSERDHEHAVAKFLEALGYRSAEEIRFQRSNIDIVLAPEGRTLAIIEVKADRGLVSAHRTVLGQALGYALEAGAPVVIISNGNYYAIFDRRVGLLHEESLVGEFRLLSLTAAALDTIEKLRKGLLR